MSPRPRLNQLAPLKRFLRIAGALLTALGVMLLPLATGIGPTMDPNAFNGLDGTRFFAKTALLVVACGVALLLAAAALPRSADRS